MSVNIALHLWSLTGPPAEEARLAAHLSGDEAARAARFVHDRDRRAYRFGRGRLREILGAVTGIAPKDLTFDYGSHGKPELREGPQFNLSHSDGIACLAIHPDIVLGVDIEALRPMEDGVAQRFFTPHEYATLSALPQASWSDGFFRCWTRKEAVVKAIGDGLSIPLDAFDVTLSPNHAPRMTRLRPTHGRLADWSLVHFDLRRDPNVAQAPDPKGELAGDIRHPQAPGMVGALAAATGGAPITITVETCPAALDFDWSV